MQINLSLLRGVKILENKIRGTPTFTIRADAQYHCHNNPNETTPVFSFIEAGFLGDDDVLYAMKCRVLAILMFDDLNPNKDSNNGPLFLFIVIKLRENAVRFKKSVYLPYDYFNYSSVRGQLDIEIIDSSAIINPCHIYPCPSTGPPINLRETINHPDRDKWNFISIPYNRIHRNRIHIVDYVMKTMNADQGHVRQENSVLLSPHDLLLLLQEHSVQCESADNKEIETDYILRDYNDEENDDFEDEASDVYHFDD